MFTFLGAIMHMQLTHLPMGPLDAPLTFLSGQDAVPPFLCTSFSTPNLTGFVCAALLFRPSIVHLRIFLTGLGAAVPFPSFALFVHTKVVWMSEVQLPGNEGLPSRRPVAL